MDFNTRYPTIIKNKKKYYLILNQGHKHKGYTELFKLKEKEKNYKFIESKKILDNKCCISHNFTIIKDKEKDIYYGIGGKNSNQPPWNYNDKIYYPGIYLLKSYDLLNWTFVKKEPIIDLNYPKNAIYTNSPHPEPKGPLWDSNICCFYSKLLKKYILYIRANLKPHIRFIQQITSNDLITWSNYKKININNHDENNHNYYMFKVVELEDKKVFFGLSPFINKKNNPTKMYIKKMISFDSLNWIDCGKLIDGKLMDWCSYRMDTHVAGILYKKNKLKIFLQFGYSSNNTNKNIIMYKFTINNINDLKNIEIKKNCKKNILI